MVAAKEAYNIDPQMRQILMQMGQPVPQSVDPYESLEQILRYEKYEVRRVDLTQESPLPPLDEFDTLAIINPRSLNDRQRWEIRSRVKTLIISRPSSWLKSPTVRRLVMQTRY